MTVLVFIKKKIWIKLIAILYMGSLCAGKSFFDRLGRWSVAECIERVQVNRQVYFWYLDNNIEQMNDVQRADLLAHFPQSAKAQQAMPSVEKVDNCVYTALESIPKYAPKKPSTWFYIHAQSLVKTQWYTREYVEELISISYQPFFQQRRKPF